MVAAWSAPIEMRGSQLGRRPAPCRPCYTPHWEAPSAPPPCSTSAMAGYFAADARIAASGSFIARGSLHEPAVADHQALPGQRVGLEGGERERDVGDVVAGGELAKIERASGMEKVCQYG